MKPSVSIIGWAHTRFGKLAGRSLESLIVETATEALSHAEVPPADVDEIALGHFNAGFSEQDFTAALVLQADCALRFKPATRVENACATGSAAILYGIKAIESGAASIVLVVGAEKMSDCPAAEVGRKLLRASYIAEEGTGEDGFAGVFARIARLYFERYGDQSDALAKIAAKAHRNGSYNPYAQLRKDVGYEFCREVSEQNPLVVRPLRRTDCCPISDGAAALVLATNDVATGFRRAVRIRAMVHVQDFLPLSRRNILELEGCRVAWQRALDQAGLRMSNLSFVESHDCFTIAELLEYEAMGLAPAGKGARVVDAGYTEIAGPLPVNPSGGLKAKGHPIGATGVSMHVMSAMQLCDSAPIGIQVTDATLGGVFNMGGAGVANYVTILERGH